MNLKNNKEFSNINTSNVIKKKKYYKWTFWPTFIAVLFFVNFLIIVAWFISDPEFFTSAKEVIPTVWAAIVTLLTAFGVVNSRKTSLLRLLRLPPIGSIIVLYTIITLGFSFYIIAIRYNVHKVNIIAKYDGKIREGIDIFWQNEKKGSTNLNGVFQIDYVKAGNYQLKVNYGTVSDSHQVQVGWWPLDKHDSIFLEPIKIQNYGSLYITTTLNGNSLEGAEVIFNYEKQNMRTPDTLVNLIVSEVEYEVKAAITRNGRIYKGSRLVKIDPLIVKTININLEYVNTLSANLNVQAKRGSQPANGGLIFLNGTRTNLLTPVTIPNLTPNEYDIKVMYIDGDFYYGASQRIQLAAGSNVNIILSLEPMGRLCKVYISPIGSNVKIGRIQYGDSNPISLIPGTYTFIGRLGEKIDTVTKIINPANESDDVEFNFD